ncbi:major facilitator superfamily protein [Klebsiella pneumoniae]|uniref:Major facilitator superfamily protein n=1 Tax=Klebsiella pneumoniae TaxID=573 RepID=A0A3S4HI40_KLEPN|nr:major facilitator superfamily protein [Klebsiella pneumoniae]
MILASGSAALAQLYDGAQRTRAFSILGTVFGVGLAFGPLLIGFMTDAVVGAAYTPCLRCSRR